MNYKGFIQVPILIAIIVGLIVVGGAGYFGVRQYMSRQTGQKQDTNTANPQTSSQGEKSLETVTKPSSAAPIEAKKETPQKIARTDFGCWPSSCSVIPQPDDQKHCEDWKAGKKVQWGDCSIYSSIQPACQKLCEFEKSSATAVVQPKQQEAACNLGTLKRQFSNTPYYMGPLIDGHFHMPGFQPTPGKPERPVLDQSISRHDVACIFDKERVKSAISFYGVPINLQDSAVQAIAEINQQYPGVIIPFLEFVSFPGYPVVPSKVEQVINANPGLFPGYGELSLYLDYYSGVKPNDPTMYELYKIAEKHHLVVMIHLTNDEQQAFEEALRDFPNVKFLLHAAEDYPWANAFFAADFDKYPNLYYSVDITLIKDAIFPATTKQEFISNMRQGWQNMLSQDVSTWKNRIEKYPDRFLWGTDRGHYAWHYDPEVEAWLEEFARTFIGQLDPAVQEKYAYKNAESLLQKR